MTLTRTHPAIREARRELARDSDGRGWCQSSCSHYGMVPTLESWLMRAQTGVSASVLSRFICVRFFAALWIVACQAPLSVRFSRQEYQGGLPCPPPRDLPYPGIKPMSLASPALFITCAPLGSPEPGSQPRRAAGLPGEKPRPCNSSPFAGTPKL